MNKPVVICGEASETESEDETESQIEPVRLTTASVSGEVITGEDSESDSEYDGNASVASAISASHLCSESEHRKQESSTSNSGSLLTEKLKENNRKLHGDIEAYCQNIVDESHKMLNNIDQQLLKSQLTLQNAVTCLKNLSGNTVALKNKIHSLLSSKFIATVNVEENN